MVFFCRSVSHYLFLRKIKTVAQFVISTVSGSATVVAEEGVNGLQPTISLPIRDQCLKEEADCYEMKLNGQRVTVHSIDMGNPHAIVWNFSVTNDADLDQCAKHVVRRLRS